MDFLFSWMWITCLTGRMISSEMPNSKRFPLAHANLSFSCFALRKMSAPQNADLWIVFAWQRRGGYPRMEWSQGEEVKVGEKIKNKRQEIIRSEHSVPVFSWVESTLGWGQMRFECAIGKARKIMKIFLYIYAWNVYNFMNLKETCRRHIFTFVTRTE